MFLTKPSKLAGKLCDCFYKRSKPAFFAAYAALAAAFVCAVYLRGGLVPACVWGALALAGAFFRLPEALPKAPRAAYLAAAIGTGWIVFKAFSKNRVLWAVPLDILFPAVFLSLVFAKAFPNIAANRKLLRIALLTAAAPAFIVTFYLATDAFVNNFSDFPFCYQQLFPSIFADFVKTTILATILLLAQKPSRFGIGAALTNGLTLAVYVQYMFMNKRLGRIGMEEFDWGANAGYAVFNGFVWAFIIAVPFLMMKFNPGLWKKLSLAIPGAMLALHVLTAGTMLATTKNDIFGRDNHYYMTSDEMYTVSKRKNVIVIVYDAADNKYIDEVMREKPELLEGLEDFTVYTNTCSVYDFTTLSFAQMFGGAEFDPTLGGDEFFEKAWRGDKTKAFYGGLHDMNYKVNAFNMSGGSPRFWTDVFDNATYSEKPVKPIPSTIYKGRMKRRTRSLAAYRALPFAAKRLVDDEDLDFENVVIFDYGYKYYVNDEFAEHLKLVPADNDKNYFTIQHLKGTHYPCDVDKEMGTCFEVTRSYVEQLKEMGVYDDATIVLTSDHGEHSSGEYGATPILMIKEAGAKHNEIELNAAPVYFPDLIPTFAIEAGFDKEKAEELFGKSIYSLKEGEERERIWYDRMEDSNYPNAKIYGNQLYYSSYNVFYAYAYTGGADELDRKVREGEIAEIYPFKEFIQ